MHVVTNKKQYEIVKALEAAENIRMDSYFIVRYVKKADQNMLVIERGVSTGYPTSTKWKLHIDDNDIIVEKKKTFDQFISFIFVAGYTFIVALIFIIALLVLVTSIIKNNIPDISTIGIGLLSVLVSAIVAIVSVVGYKCIYFDKPKEILKKYFEKYII